MLVIFFAVAFVFLFFLFGLLSKEDIGLRRAIRKVRVEALREYSAHVHMVLCALGGSSKYGLWGADGLTGQKTNRSLKP